MSVKLIWTTPKGDDLLTYMARVSNPTAELGDPGEKLIKYLMKNKHWSPFEMVHACIEINTTRDIARQILRHRSFSFQEFSQRYGVVESKHIELREARLQCVSNRQHSLPNTDKKLDLWWTHVQADLLDHTQGLYKQALENGIAKEVARAILMEGLTPTKMYMVGSLRSWMHYWAVRCDEATQKEHRLIAEQTCKLVLEQYPIMKDAINAQGE